MDLVTRRLAALLVFGTVAFLSPLIGAFNEHATLFGLPLLPAYIFACWAALVAGAWLCTRRRRR